ncbi:hypothetical protein T4D_11247 [Trichinella pseudospiralis]|uniref:Uncharacterized protein n=1 Tax=Trichinella pseudospiralis TaxID=6337 RepID=A0A0V1FU53_TRIPS|nr:hypothetical protein T4D_11247 [Trichinella pseudospiralis]
MRCTKPRLCQQQQQQQQQPPPHLHRPDSASRVMILPVARNHPTTGPLELGCVDLKSFPLMQLCKRCWKISIQLSNNYNKHHHF